MGARGLWKRLFEFPILSHGLGAHLAASDFPDAAYTLADYSEKFALAIFHARDVKTHLEHAIRVTKSIGNKTCS